MSEPSAPVPESANARSPRARLSAHVAVPVAYVGASVLLWWNLLTHIRSRTYGAGDAYLFTWWLGWASFALRHAHLPFRSGWLNYPHGVNAMWNTSVLLLGLLAAPLTALAGPLVSFNLLLMAAPAASATSCYFVAASLFGNRKRAALAGLLYGFSPYFIGQSAGHLQMTWAVFPPLLVWLFAQVVVRQRLPPMRLGLALGLAVGLQLWIGEELLASAALLALLTGLVLAVSYRHEIRRRVRYVVTCLGWAVAVAVAVDALPIYVQFFGPQRVHGAVQSQAPGADLLSFVLPTPLVGLHFVGAFAGLQQRVLGTNLAEQTAYVGVPLLVLTIGAAVSSRRDVERRLLAVPLAIAVILSLGRGLVVGGRRTGLTLPAAGLGHLPLLQSMLPVRLSLYVDLFAALLVASWVGRSAGAFARRSQYAVLALAVVTLLPRPLPAFPAATPDFFTAHRLGGLRPTAAVFVAPYPGPGAPAPMLWQAMSGMRFRMVGGYFVGPDAAGHAVFGSPPGPTARAVSAIETGATVADEAPSVTAVSGELADDRLDAVIVGPMPRAREVVAFLEAVSGRRASKTGGVWLIRLRP